MGLFILLLSDYNYQSGVVSPACVRQDTSEIISAVNQRVFPVAVSSYETSSWVPYGT